MKKETKALLMAYGAIALATGLIILPLALEPSPAHDPVAIDGDTFDAGGVRYRLARIDAPEMPNHPCRPGRVCVEGDAVAAKDALDLILMLGPVTCKRVETDVYGRTVAECWVDGLNISDAMLNTGLAKKYERRRR